MADLTTSATIDAFMAAANAAAARAVLSIDTPSDARPPTAHTHPALQISDSTATGRSVITAANAADARTAITVDTPSDARPPTAHTHPALELTDSTAFGRSMLTAASEQLARNTLGSKFVNNGISGILYFDHFINGTSYRDGFSSSLASGASVAVASATDVFGAIRVQTGTNAAPRQAMIGVPNNPDVMRIGMGALTFVARTRFTFNLFSGGINGRVYSGFFDGNTTSEPTDGCYFRTVNGGNWFAVVRSANSETVLDLGVAPALNTWFTREVTINAAGTEVRFYVDNVLVAFFTSAAGVDSGINKYNVTTIPNGSDYFGAGFGLCRDTNTTNCAYDSDFALVHYAPTTPFDIT